MPTYTVFLCRSTIEFTNLEVEAETEEEAGEEALAIVNEPSQSKGFTVYWEADDSSAGEIEVNKVLFKSE